MSNLENLESMINEKEQLINELNVKLNTLINTSYADYTRDLLVQACRERGLKVGNHAASKNDKKQDLQASLEAYRQAQITKIQDHIASAQQKLASFRAELDAIIAEEQAAETQIEERANEEENKRVIVKNLKSRILPVGYSLLIIREGATNGVEAYFNDELIGVTDTVLKAHKIIGKHAPRVALPSNYRINEIKGKYYILKLDENEDQFGRRNMFRYIDNKGNFIEDVNAQEEELCYRVKFKQAEKHVLKLAGLLDSYLNR